jgi:hypothetical protein
VRNIADTGSVDAMRLRIVTALALVLAACGGGGDQDTATSPSVEDPGTTAVAGTTGSGPTSTASPDPASTTAEPPGEAAPDFTLALSDGSDFTLSAEQKPVYMVFWAEW